MVCFLARFFGRPVASLALPFWDFYRLPPLWSADRLRLQGRCDVKPNSSFAAPCRFMPARAFPQRSIRCRALATAALGDALHAALQGHHAALYEPREIAPRSHFGRPGRCVNKGVGLRAPDGPARPAAKKGI